ncbi:hypothetical protein B0T26DRAFT_730185 [Lasiosphaeria miniovina]|uniref:Uncharacterized protein n=1 Tax=Lasiosphaeria miniovina TaxID=1954250 RepID=A0AA39ZT38_9PEZI|nr:uncharacterized protein B0T26DRAFT_730185 [Lasiosphaeria miniovina]KAK0703201.1 hypothetical protein B0T26DRAFT_730185 [Lasiosphaeria miniovina]
MVALFCEWLETEEKGGKCPDSVEGTRLDSRARRVVAEPPCRCCQNCRNPRTRARWRAVGLSRNPVRPRQRPARGPPGRARLCQAAGQVTCPPGCPARLCPPGLCPVSCRVTCPPGRVR